MSGISFVTTDWSQVEATEHKGVTGVAYWRTQSFGGIRVRMVEYTPGYFADHWCVKGHILLCTPDWKTRVPGYAMTMRYPATHRFSVRPNPDSLAAAPDLIDSCRLR